MSSYSLIPNERAQWQSLWQNTLKTNRPLLGLVMVSFGLFLLTVALNIIDSRVVTGAPVWIKPMKFAISITLYSATLIWMLSLVEGKKRLVKIIAIGTTVGFAVEYVAIFIQAARGVRSHFNLSTPLDAALFNFMGGFVVLIWILNLLTAFLLIRQPMANKPLAWGIRLGLLVTAVGAALGFIMTSTPSPAQREALAAGEPLTIFGAHSVGVEDGGEGLPFTNWSVEGGDLRVPHFVGLHALQLLPLFGIVVNRLRWPQNQRTALVWIGGLGYLTFVGILTWQALRGQPVIAPDSQTLTALGSLFGALLVTSAAVYISTHLKN